MEKKDKLLYFIVPIVIYLIIYYGLTLFFSFSGIRKLLMLELFVYFVIAIYLFVVNKKKENLSKVKLFIMFSASFFVDLIIMFLFIHKGHYNHKIVKILIVMIIFVVDYLMLKLFSFNRKNSLRDFIKNNFNKLFFLGVYFMFTLIVLVKLCLNSNVINYVENRSSYRFNLPRFNEVLDSTFQNNFENAVIDQMPKYDLLKNVYNKISMNILLRTLKFTKLDETDKYVTLNNGINFYKDYLLYNVQSEEDFKLKADDDIESINKIYKSVNVNMYLYFVETDSNNRFDINYDYDAISYLKANLNLSSNNIGAYEIKGFEKDYRNNFYKTDHHWNNNGSYRGYREIAEMMDFEKVLENNDEVCFNEIRYSGSKTRTLGDKTYFYDYVCVYDFDFPDFDITVNDDKLNDYGHSIEEVAESTDISYGYVYGGDYSEIIFSNKNNKNNKKLLIYSNSYSNAINKLLASNYKTTYVVDGRYYEDYDMVSYVEDNEIDDILIIANSMLFWDNVDW